MRFKIFSSAAILVAIASFGLSGPVYAQTAIEAIALSAVSPDASKSADAIAALRAKGPNGLQTFLEVYGDELKRDRTNPAISSPQSRLNAMLDTICQQRDCYESRLYWYTDLEQAKAQAKAEGKPILSLRLLGRLDEEYSCANSRFFRIALYPNAEVSKLLRDRFILHWQSVRPVPKVTIDFGDGRQMQRTLTGNSIHYILDAEGRAIDALPGLYGPKAFQRQLEQAEKAVKESSRLTDSQRDEFLRQYYRSRLAEIEGNWAADLSKLGISLPLGRIDNPQSSNNVPTAEQAGQVAIGKSRVELPVVRAISPVRTVLENATDDSIWAKLAQLHVEEARLDINSQTLMRRKNPIAYQVDESLQRTVRNFERSIAADTVRNEYLLHTKLYQWFAEGVSTKNVQTLNERVYAELFLTPSSDPWLGLFPSDAYTAIENDGIGRN
ncbi:thioredoxin family protein [Argonema galeatum]|uniref:thioredoxin family protein n=1 Tax=Argonema galeatum TaxID=2942762 RepID=UPI002013A241|nr:thioredoxin family protein [Argonema galeatum]MCL1466307.1 thioredoxin family protein [Argonema galeatum A003/A1]